MEKNNNFLAGSILAAALIVSGALIYVVGDKKLNNKNDNSGKETAQTEELGIGENVILGDSSAPVTLITFGDFQCPFCGKWERETAPKIRDNYVKTGKVKMVSRDFAFLGDESTQAALAAECAKDQGKYWAYHDSLYNEEKIDGEENNGNLTREKFLEIADSLGLNSGSFAECFDSKKYLSEVEKDYEDGQAAGVRSTPTIFVNGRKFEGALPYETFKKAIEEALK
ncbi:MAG: DsbA family protein [Parcubacteria group bacterium]|nr:DsbA family protein [Parcubacteria group bacterium]